MRLPRVVRSLVLVLTLARPVTAEDGQWHQTPGDDIDLGTAVPAHGEVLLGPFAGSVGLFERVQVGTRVLPWFVGVLVPGSIVPNGYAKGLLIRRGHWSAAAESALFYVKLDDLDGDGLNARAWVWPTRLLVGADVTRRIAWTLELAGVHTDVSARSPRDTDTRIEGVAVARSAHAGLLPRYRLTRWMTLWARLRILLGHSPVTADAETELSGGTRLRIHARANGAELSSGLATVAGVHLHGSWISVSAAVGYGTWFLPWVYLPVGHNVPIGELDLTFRF